MDPFGGGRHSTLPFDIGRVDDQRYVEQCVAECLARGKQIGECNSILSAKGGGSCSYTEGTGARRVQDTSKGRWAAFTKCLSSFKDGLGLGVLAKGVTLRHGESQFIILSDMAFVL